MNEKELVQKFFKGRAVPRPPFIPLIGTYITKVDQISTEQLYSDSSTLFSAVLNTQQLLGYDALMMPIDITIEAEALGASINWHKDRMPSISGHLPLDQDIKITGLNTKGRLPILIETINRIVIVHGKKYPVIATLTGPLTILKQVYGEEIFKQDPKIVEKIVGNISQALIQLCKDFGEAKVDGIIINEDIDLNSFKNMELGQFYTPINNVIKYYNIFGVLRLSTDINERKDNFSDTMIGSREFILDYDKVKIKGIAVNESFWMEPFNQADLSTIWHEHKKRRLFFSTSKPIDLHIDLSKFQEKVPLLCKEETWT